ncbi:DNA repair protein RadA [Candidatus Uhrbacteria bacterium]|jgi:DNA repair protein RadA/Sms|nr:DNA repair protein RadA [Candidatus Uhrbacteria bacterium]
MLNCSNCDAQYSRWQGRCTECAKWGTIADDTGGTSTKSKKGGATAAPLVDLGKADVAPTARVSTKIPECDRVLSGGLVAGSVTLLAGEPGVGKSTLVAQLAASFASDKACAYYVSGEESQGQIAMRLKRLELEPKNIAFSNSVEIDRVIATAKKLKPALLIVDSIQTALPQGVDSTPGTPTSVRAATSQLISYAKASNVPVIIIGQVTKDGSVAGPKTLEHLVDTVLSLEGDRDSSYRILRAGKHRFGGTDEIGFFEMSGKGMTSIDNPSARFLEERTSTPGSVVTCLMEGTRPILVEIQALVEKSTFANPIRRTSGYDATRLQMLIAIINKRTKHNVGNQDVYVNVVGGIKIKEHAADLAVCAAIISSVTDKALSKEIAVFGELGLGGEVRSVPYLEKRVKEADRLGFKRPLSPKNIKQLSEFSL